MKSTGPTAKSRTNKPKHRDETRRDETRRDEGGTIGLNWNGLDWIGMRGMRERETKAGQPSVEPLSLYVYTCTRVRDHCLHHCAGKSSLSLFLSFFLFFSSSTVCSLSASFVSFSVGPPCHSCLCALLSSALLILFFCSSVMVDYWNWNCDLAVGRRELRTATVGCVWVGGEWVEVQLVRLERRKVSRGENGSWVEVS